MASLLHVMVVIKLLALAHGQGIYLLASELSELAIAIQLNVV